MADSEWRAKISRIFAAVEHFFIGLTFPAGKLRQPTRNRPFPVNLIPELNDHKLCMLAFVSVRHYSSAT
jgi:hypothetical protein